MYIFIVFISYSKMTTAMMTYIANSNKFMTAAFALAFTAAACRSDYNSRANIE